MESNPRVASGPNGSSINSCSIQSLMNEYHVVQLRALLKQLKRSRVEKEQSGGETGKPSIWENILEHLVGIET